MNFLYRLYFQISFLFISTNLVSCNYLNPSSLLYSIYNISNGLTSSLYYLDEENDDLEVYTMNQFNNLQLFGFGLIVYDYIYFSDGFGIHKADRNFKNIKTLVYNERYKGLLESIRPLSMFSGLQHYDGKIYFLDLRSSSIYSMNLDGSDITVSINFLDLSEERYIYGEGLSHVGGISEFIVVNSRIYFNYFLGGARLHYFDMYSGKITDLNIFSAPILTLSPHGDALQFNHDLSVLTNLYFYNHERSVVNPINIHELFKNGYVNHLVYTTNANGNIAFASHGRTQQGYMISRIFIINENGYASYIYENIGEIIHPTAINSIGSFIYFITENYPHDVNINLNRIRRDGSDLELIYEGLFTLEYPNHFQHDVFINILSEDIILFRRNPAFHETYALIRNEHTGELIRRRLN